MVKFSAKNEPFKFSAKKSSRRYVTQYHVTLDSHCVLQRTIKVEGEVLSL